MRGFVRAPFAAIAIAALAATTGAMGVAAANRAAPPTAQPRVTAPAAAAAAGPVSARTPVIRNAFAAPRGSHENAAARPASAANPELPIHPRDVASGYTASNVSMERNVPAAAASKAPPVAGHPTGSMRAAATATIGGTVYDSGSNPVSGASVQIDTVAATGWKGYANATTNASGAWSKAVPIGQIAVAVYGGAVGLPNGYYSAGGFVFREDEATVLTVGSGGLTGIDVRIATERAVSGRIVGPGGTGIAGLTVTLHQTGWPTMAMTTDATGNYSQTPYAPGAVTISVTDDTGVYADGWYTSAGFSEDPAKATAVTFDGFNETAVATLTLPYTHLVSGKVTNAAGAGLAYAEVDVYVGGSFYAWAATASNGTFSIRLGPADYTLYFYDYTLATAPGWYSSAGLVSDPAFAGTYTVGASDRSGLTVGLPVARHIKGKIYYGASPIPQVDVTADSNETWHSFGQTASDGSYSIPVPAGNYVVYVTSPTLPYSDGYLASSGLTADPSAAQVVTVSGADVTVRNLGLALSTGLAGTVLSGSNYAGLDGVIVELFASGVYYASSGSMRDGEFAVNDLGLGAYEIAFYDPSGKYASGWYSTAGFVRSFADASDVTVGAAAVSGLTTALPLQTVPNAPTAVTATPFHSSAAVSWSPPANDGYNAIGRYTVTASPSGKSCAATGKLTCTVSGLTDGTPYTFTVKATNAKGTSVASSPSAAVSPLGVPGAPTGVKVTRGTASATIGWTAPAANGGAISSYTVTTSPASAGCTATTATSCKVTGLSNGTWYTFSVTARNAIGPGPASNTTAMQPNTPEVRYGGTDAFATAAAVSAHSFPANCGCTAYVAFVGNFPDALGGAAAAGTVNGPVLFANTTGILSTATVVELNRLQPNRIVVLGGSGAIADPVFHALEWYAPEVDRYFGAGRFDTAAAISRGTFAANCGCTAYIAYAYNFPDALGGAAASGKVKGPVLLVDSAGPINAATSTELTRLKPARIVVLGGTGVVPDAIYNLLKPYASSITRYYGPSRYDTAASISSHTFAASCGCVAYVAVGTDFNGALAGAAAAGRVGGPLLLVSNALPIPAATDTELKRLKPTQVVVIGGTAQIPDSIYKVLAAYAPAS